ncbi:MAG: hypothetical protein Q9220_006276 [cf. Caloplaca sp. 1 TL-2023]
MCHCGLASGVSDESEITLIASPVNAVIRQKTRICLPPLLPDSNHPGTFEIQQKFPILQLSLTSMQSPLLLLQTLTLFLLLPSTLAVAMTCFRPRPGSPILHPTTFKSCYAIQFNLVKSASKPKAPITFSRNPSLGYKLPEYWQVGNCALLLDMNTDEEGVQETMSFFEIATDVGPLNVECVAKAPHMGGTYPVGPRGAMNVTLIGVAPAVVGEE